MEWNPPTDWVKVSVIDAHAGGEPLRLILSGFPELTGSTILEKRDFARREADHLRKLLMWEPRGHADMYGCLLVPPTSQDGDAGVLFMHNQGYSTMCGHGIIALVTIGLECGILKPRNEDIRLDTPAGRVTARARRSGGRVESVSFINVPSFVSLRDGRVQVPPWGEVRFDLAFGGAFYAYVDAADLGLSLTPKCTTDLIDAGRRIKKAISANTPIRHPQGDPDLNFLYGVIFVDGGAPDVHSRNVCIFADGEVDRSPTGTGVSGRAAILHSQGVLEQGDWITIESLIGSRFSVRVSATCRLGEVEAVIPEVRGQAHLVGRSEFFLDPEDVFGRGFLLR